MDGKDVFIFTTCWVFIFGRIFSHWASSIDKYRNPFINIAAPPIVYSRSVDRPLQVKATIEKCSAE